MLRKFLFTASDDYCKIGIRVTGAGVLFPFDDTESILPTLNLDGVGEVGELEFVAAGDKVKAGILMPSPNMFWTPPPPRASLRTLFICLAMLL